jgi:hypothetical protein
MNSKEIKNICERHKGCGSEYHTTPIPERKLRGAKEIIGNHPAQEVFALIDCTVFGGASDGIVFTDIGILAKQAADKRSSYISWEQFKKAEITEENTFLSKYIFISETKLDLAGADTFVKNDNHSIFKLLQEIQLSMNLESQDIQSNLEQATDGTTQCRYCGNNVKKYSVFCKHCGIRLVG